MYIILTLPELNLYLGRRSGRDGLSASPLDDDDLGVMDFDHDGQVIPREVSDAREIALSEGLAREWGILAPRDQFWTRKAQGAGYFTGAVPRAKLPEHAIGYPEVDPEKLRQYLQSLRKSS